MLVMKPIRHVYTAEQARAIDGLAVQLLEIPSFTLMERAGQFAFDSLRSEWPDTRSIHVVAGSGNNAGDGFMVAALAKSAGLEITVQLVGDADRLSGDALLAYERMHNQGVSVSEDFVVAEVVVDALLGTGATGPIRPPYQTAIAAINNSLSQTLALDLPTGINASTGGLLSDNPVRAKLTCSFVCAKMGTLTGPGIDYCGQLRYSALDVPDELFIQNPGVAVLEYSLPAVRSPVHDLSAHKYDKGTVLIVGGDHSMGGAAILAAEAAQQVGAGLVSVLTRQEHIPPLLTRCPECIATAFNSETAVDQLVNKADVVAIGPGLGTSNWSEEIFHKVMKHKPQKLVIDADALRLLKGVSVENLSRAVLTPHPGEAARLLTSTSTDVNQDRPAQVVALSNKFGCTVILKGAGSLIAANGKLKFLSSFANPALATAGSGDVLTGLIAGSYLTTENPVIAAQVGSLLHRNACIQAEQVLNRKVLLARNLIENVNFGKVLKNS